MSHWKEHPVRTGIHGNPQRRIFPGGEGAIWVGCTKVESDEHRSGPFRYGNTGVIQYLWICAKNGSEGHIEVV